MLPWWSERLASLRLSMEQPDLRITVCPISDVSGEATITRSGEDTQFSFNLEFSLNFDLEKEEPSSTGYIVQTSSCGKIHITNFSSGNEDVFDVRLEGTDVSLLVAEAQVVPKLKEALRDCVVAYESIAT